MNKTKLKSYAPQARKDFIAAVTARANLLGLAMKNGALEVAPSQPQGDTTVIAGQAWPAKVHGQRQQLIDRIKKDGFAQTMEAVAYTWFNRFAALRYMELHDYLGHGHRALSSLEGTLPDILTHAADLAQSGDLPGLNPGLVVEMKLAGNRDGELYRMLLVAQCNALSNIMPFLFERIDDETELLLPDNLLRTDSVIAKLVSSIEEEDWKEVEIIGWLYQFYISEKKDQVIGKVVKSEDIPAATQLFTPNWIVQYLVQNSVGRLWLMANPASTLQAQWPYYIAPADQTPEVQAQLDALIQTRVDEDGDSLNPVTMTMLDPACGSGHILVEAYEVFKAIYLERGYQPRSIPRLILEKNLYGLDIDDRAAQMAGFALLMKARADDRRLFNEPVKLNVLSLQESKGLDVDELARTLQSVAGGDGAQLADSAARIEFGEDDLFPGTSPQFFLGESSAVSLVSNPVDNLVSDSARQAIAALIATFEHAKTFGSLIQIPPALNAQLVAMAKRLQTALLSGDLYAKAAAQDLLPLVAQARMLGMQFDAVIANPPYMGGKAMNSDLKEFAKKQFPSSKSDLFAMFIERNLKLVKNKGWCAMITMPSWLFLSSYESLRREIINNHSIDSLLHLGRGIFGIDFGSTAFVIKKNFLENKKGCFFKLHEKSFQHIYYEDIAKIFLNSLKINNYKYDFTSYRDTNGISEILSKSMSSGKQVRYTFNQDDFIKIPGSPIAYWVSNNMQKSFISGNILSRNAEPKQGLATTDNNRFIRLWHELDINSIFFCAYEKKCAINSNKKWFPFNKGGEFRKWYGNQDFVVNWFNDGFEIKENILRKYPYLKTPDFVAKNQMFYFKESVSWSKISSSQFSVRYFPKGFVFADAGMSMFSESIHLDWLCGLFNSNVATDYLCKISPTLNFEAGTIGNFPMPSVIREEDAIYASECIKISKMAWKENEVSWDFSNLNFINKLMLPRFLNISWEEWSDFSINRISEVKKLEEENNRIFINAYGLQDELFPEIPEDQITLTRADREKDSQRLISYAIGCMMGRYSLDEPGLIYANSGNIGFDASRYNKFSADFDGIVPLNDEIWFEDEAATRIREFLFAVWGADTLAENMAWLAESLGAKAGETPEETIRRYLADKFYKDHLQTYRKRPIYWLFSSGKQGAFQALVYLHRYHEGTLSRMRAEYVVPLTGKIKSRMDMLEKDAAAASSTAARNKLNKEIEQLKKKHVELLAYDEQLRHHADMRIALDLDDGVKVNYGKFGNLLADVKVVTGGAGDD